MDLVNGLPDFAATTATVDNSTDDPGPDDDPKVLESIAIIECLLLGVGVFGNTMLFVLMRSKRMKKHSFSVYFSFSAVFDTLSIFWNCLQDTYELTNTESFEERAASPFSFGCGVLELFDGWFPLSSAWLMVALALDRFVSICFPQYSEKFCRRGTALLISLLVTGVMFIVSLPWKLMKGPSGNDSDDPVLCSDESNDNDNITDVVLLLLVPVCCVSVINVAILVKLGQKRAFRYEDSLTEHGRSQNRINRLNVTIFYLLVITLVTWIPLMIVDLYETIYFDWEGHDDHTMTRVRVDYAWHACLVIWLFTFVQNFYVLMAMSPIYRREVKRQCICLPCFDKQTVESLDPSETVTYKNLQENEDA